MTDSTDATIPLAAHRKALREAFIEGAQVLFAAGSPTRPQDLSGEALARWPEPEPELRWVKADDTPGTEVAFKDGAIVRRWADGRSVRPWLYLSKSDVDLVRSLLPREPVAVTEAMVAKARQAYRDATGKGFSDWIRAALLAVAADLAGPVGERPKAQWWGVVDKDGDIVAARTKDRAIRFAAQWDMEYPQSAPHRAVGLAEVEG